MFLDERSLKRQLNHLHRPRIPRIHLDRPRPPLRENEVDPKQPHQPESACQMIPDRRDLPRNRVRHFPGRNAPSINKRSFSHPRKLPRNAREYRPGLCSNEHRRMTCPVNLLLVIKRPPERVLTSARNLDPNPAPGRPRLPKPTAADVAARKFLSYLRRGISTAPQSLHQSNRVANPPQDRGPIAQKRPARRNPIDKIRIILDRPRIHPSSRRKLARR